MALTWNPLQLLGVVVAVVLGSAFFSCLSMTIAGIVLTRDRLMGIGQAITMPLFFGSSALYPVSIMPGWLQAVSRANPLSYQVDALRGLLVGTATHVLLDFGVLVVARSPGSSPRHRCSAGSRVNPPYPSGMLAGMDTARVMWTLFEPVHAVTYFSPEARAGFEAAGLHGFWRGYFAGRAAPLGPIGPAPVVASFFGFAPPMVERAVPDVWQRAAVPDVLATRLAGATAALARLAAGLPGRDLAEAADLLATAAARADCGGRVLAAANAALPVPDEPLGRIWQSATTLREHRGDGHVAALVAAGYSGRDALIWRAADDLDRTVVQPARGWTDEQWDQSVRRLTADGRLDADGRPTEAGRAAFAAVEAATDRAAAGPWEGVDTDRLRALLTPLTVACRGGMPVNPIGLPAPDAA